MGKELKFNSLTRILGVDGGLGEMHPWVKLIVDQLKVHHVSYHINIYELISVCSDPRSLGMISETAYMYSLISIVRPGRLFYNFSDLQMVRYV